MTDGVSSGLVAVAANEAGLSRAETAAAFEDLRREGVNAPEPTRESVDDLLRSMEMRVRFDPNLSEHKRRTISERLRAALGRVVPDRATLYAWRNIVAEAWARSRRKVVAVFLAGAVSFGVGACGNAPADHVSPNPENPVITDPANPTAEAPVTDTAVQSPTVAAATYSDAAVATFGQPGVDAAYQEAVAFASENTFNPALINPNGQLSSANFAAATSHMSPTMAAQYTDLVNKAMSGDADARSSLQVMSFYNLSGPGVIYHESGPMIVNHAISGGRVEVEDGGGRAAVTLDQRGDLRVNHNGSPVLVPLNKTMTYWLVPAPAGSATAWHIDGLSGPWNMGSPTPDTGAY